MELSKRLAAVAGMVTKGNVVCDAGCDHGYVSIFLVLEKISPKVIAMDIRDGPLSRAQEHIRMYGLSDYIETRLSDGVEKLEMDEADALILAGMGGRLMESILTRGMEKVLRMKELILQPQSELPQFRRFLRKEGFLTCQENMVFEDGKYYPMMRVLPGKGESVKEITNQRSKCSVENTSLSDFNLHTEECLEKTGILPTYVCAAAGGMFEGGEMELADRYGGLLLSGQHPVLGQYLEFQRQQLLRVQREICATAASSEKSRKRAEEIERELLLNRRAAAYFEKTVNGRKS